MAEGPVPNDIQQLGPTEMGITWSDGHQSVYPVRDLRLACRCALCIEELTGVKRITPESIPADVRPIEVGVVGQYAIHIAWSDGHQSGIYTYTHLREICHCPDCRAS